MYEILLRLGSFFIIALSELNPDEEKSTDLLSGQGHLLTQLQITVYQICQA